jgi:hypothetical protein
MSFIDLPGKSSMSSPKPKALCQTCGQGDAAPMFFDNGVEVNMRRSKSRNILPKLKT